MGAGGRHFLDPFAMLRRGRTENHNVGLRLFEALAVVGKTAFTRNAQFVNRFFHPFGFFVADPDDFGARMFCRKAQQVAHVKVIEIDARNFPAFGFHDAEFLAALRPASQQYFSTFVIGSRHRFDQNRGMNRRSFLEAGFAVASLTPLVQRLHAAATTQTSGPRIKIGFMGASHSHAFEKVRLAKESTDFELIGIHDAAEAVRQRFATSGVRFISQETLLNEAEVIAVESAVQDHARHAELALLAGKHVHLEKPPSDSLAAFQKLIHLAREKQRLLQVGYMWRFNPGINAALEAARNGWLGNVYLVRATINTSLSAGQRREVAQFRGGTMFELGSHVIDPVVRLLGRPEKVTSFLNHHGDEDDRLADNTVAVLEFSKTLAIITSATMQPGAGAHRFFEILGANGSALVKPIEQPVLHVDLAKAAGPYAAKAQMITFPPYKRYVAELVELAQAIRQARPLVVTPQEDLAVQEALLRACEMN